MRPVAIEYASIIGAEGVISALGRKNSQNCGFSKRPPPCGPAQRTKICPNSGHSRPSIDIRHRIDRMASRVLSRSLTPQAGCVRCQPNWHLRFLCKYTKILRIQWERYQWELPARFDYLHMIRFALACTAQCHMFGKEQPAVNYSAQI
jgi:hypothetical protein